MAILCVWRCFVGTRPSHSPPPAQGIFRISPASELVQIGTGQSPLPTNGTGTVTSIWLSSTELRFRAAYRLHHQGDDSCQKAAIFIHISRRPATCCTPHPAPLILNSIGGTQPQPSTTPPCQRWRKARKNPWCSFLKYS